MGEIKHGTLNIEAKLPKGFFKKEADDAVEERSPATEDGDTPQAGQAD